VEHNTVVTKENNQQHFGYAFPSLGISIVVTAALFGGHNHTPVFHHLSFFIVTMG
jgi:hypothetical protein